MFSDLWTNLQLSFKRFSSFQCIKWDLDQKVDGNKENLTINRKFLRPRKFDQGFRGPLTRIGIIKFAKDLV